jgi:hypothetical protein
MRNIIYFILLVFAASCASTGRDLNFRDSDLDGVHDKKDACPDEPGSVFNLGCPDENKLTTALNKSLSTDDDLDGVRNDKDECPEIHGSPFNQGCPFPAKPVQ